MRLYCQKVYMGRVRCRNRTHGSGDLCRWHRIAHEFRSDLQDKPKWMISGIMSGVFPTAAISMYGLWMFHGTSQPIWLLLSLHTLGMALKHFADGIIAQDYPLSQFAFWAKLLALGMALEAVSGIGAAILILAREEEVLPLLRVISERPQWLAIGPALVATLALIFAVGPLKMLLSRIMFRELRLVNTMINFFTVCMIGLAIRSVGLKYGFARTVEESKSFWAGAVASDSTWPLAVAYFVAFNLAEVINIRMRRRGLDDEGFRKTIIISFAACFIPPGLAMLATRYLLVWSGYAGVLPFILLTTLLSIPLCVMASRIVVEQALDQRSA